MNTEYNILITYISRPYSTVDCRRPNNNILHHYSSIRLSSLALEKYISTWLWFDFPLPRLLGNTIMLNLLDYNGSIPLSPLSRKWDDKVISCAGSSIVWHNFPPVYTTHTVSAHCQNIYGYIYKQYTICITNNITFINAVKLYTMYNVQCMRLQVQDIEFSREIINNAQTLTNFRVTTQITG